jgi:hypothetical protein
VIDTFIAGVDRLDRSDFPWLFLAGVFTVLGALFAAWLVIDWLGDVRMGPDPEIPLAERETVVLPVVPPEYAQPYDFAPGVDEFFPLAEHFSRRIDETAAVVTEVIETITEEVTVTRTTELVITIYPARHRREDVESETRNLTDSIRRAKELTQ